METVKLALTATFVPQNMQVKIPDSVSVDRDVADLKDCFHLHSTAWELEMVKQKVR